jgi:outer membrane protein
MKKLLFLCLLAFTPISFAKADLKVAVIDLGKAFDSYYKTKDASTKIEQKKASYQKDIQDKMAEYQKMSDDAKKLYDQSNDPTLSAQARADRTAALKQKTQDLTNMQHQIQEMETERTNEIKDDLFRRHKEIVDEIQKTITAYAVPQGFDIVIDKSSASAASGVPIVLFTSSKLIDITPDIVKQLNANAPAPGSVPTGAAPATTH